MDPFPVISITSKWLVFYTVSSIQGPGAPPNYVCWFISHSNYGYIHHSDLANYGALPCTI